MISNLLVGSALLALVSSAVFVVLYATVRWYATSAGRSVMALACCLVLLPTGGIVYYLVDPLAGVAIRAAGWLGVAVVMAWRTVAMWRANHPREKD